MQRKPLIWQLFPTYLFVTLASLLAITLYTTESVRDFHLSQAEASLLANARLASYEIREAIVAGDYAKVDTLTKNLGHDAGTRFTVVLPSGIVVGDTEREPSEMENHAERTEVREALEGHVGVQSRFSRTIEKEMMYVAVPLSYQGHVLCIVRAAISTAAIEKALQDIYTRILIGGILVAFLAALISWAVSRRISSPLERLKHGAERFARGDLDRRLSVPRPLEIASLAEAMNEMAAQLDDRIRTVIRQRSEQEAVFRSMVEGVIAFDMDQHVISMNKAAADLFNVDLESAPGRELPEVIRNTTFLRFVDQAIESDQTTEGEIILGQHGERILQATGTVLRDVRQNVIGALVVLNDVSRLRRLERVRRDFVANVSHELRTPITSIKGFVETLLDGALRDPEEAEHFLRIVGKQADRLNAIIEDLLILSRMEQEAEKAEITLERGSLCQVLHAATELCSPAASQKGVEITTECLPDLNAHMNAPLLEQAVVNLLDNAVKYSEPGSRVHLEGWQMEHEVVIQVQDQGCGISPEHLPRLFERFYRVDKARSRSLGGTGLGLAIVKHIVQAHAGTVSVESQLGRGSVFSIKLPQVSAPWVAAAP